MAPLTHQPLPMLRNLKWHRVMNIRVWETERVGRIDFSFPADPYMDCPFWDNLAPLFLAYWFPELQIGHFVWTEWKNIRTRILNFQSLKGCPLQVPHHLGRKASLPRGSDLPKGWALFFCTRIPSQDTMVSCQSAITVIISHLDLEKMHHSSEYRPKMLRP